ncbi:DUF4274 domain-containing protein [Bradyrhizobium sp. USDA 3315]
MTGDEVRDQAQSGGGVGLSDENLALHRSAIQSRITFQGLATRPFEGLSWDYFLADVELEARAARIGMRDTTIGSYCDTIQLLPAAAIVRLDAALSVYFLPPEPESEAHVDYLLRPLDAATAKRMRQRRHAVHAMQAVAQQQEEARKKAAAPDEELKSQYWPCPHAALSTEPDDFLLWIKDQTPDTWHVIVDSWDHNSHDRDSVIEWIFEQPNCDLGTAAQYFFIAALGLANEEPAQLSSGYRRKWHLMKRVADNWQRGHYLRNELQPSTQPSDVQYYDELVARREASGRPLPWTVPGPKLRRFGGRQANSAYFYEDCHLRLGFTAWKQQREQFGCGRDFPRCCQE